jgi:TRAP-type C4-dicarboxylate transport system permease small subunit
MEKQKLNPTIQYVLSILGFLCCCVAGAGFIPAGIAYYLANQKLKEAATNPELYDGVQAMKTAKTVALVVLILNILYLAYTIYTISTVGWDQIQEQQLQIMEQWGIEQ